MAEIGDKRYVLEWIDEPTALVKARRLGYSDASDDSLWEWVDPHDCVSTRQFKSLAAAKSYGSRNRKLDLFSQPRIYVSEYRSSGAFADWVTTEQYFLDDPEDGWCDHSYDLASAE